MKMRDRDLFKAKRLDNGEWVVWNALTGIPHVTSIIQDTICQCTGMKDKNGKLIWENDIMVGHLDDDYPEDKTYIKVFWRENGFYSRENGSIDIMPFNKFDQDHFEVCGNAFDNAELLESEG